MDELSMLLNFMNAKISSFKGDYFIPEKWNSFGYEKFKTDSKRSEEINVNPYDFFSSCVQNVILNNKTENKHSGRSNVSGDVIYSILPRSFTAWRHFDNAEICSGTFLKAMLILPVLKKLGVSILYLLPVSSCSDHNKKGDFGSPYAIKDLYKIDRGLHDPLLGDYSEEMLEIEFKSFVQACHLLGIKVMVDFVFRTVARDNVLIAAHPDWFYWIKSEFGDNFKPPLIGDGEKSYYICDKTVKLLYASPNISNYFSQFTLPPNQIDKAKWEKIKSHKSDDVDSLIEQEFGITTVPGFPDVVNDRQPAWTDVTYLKYYFDCPPEIKGYVPENQPPYIMQDGASLDKFHGKDKNQELWDYITGVLPFYRKIYSIDGARIDMAHALPAELNTLIIRKIREIDSDFILWSEDLDPAKGAQAKENGFDFISGYTYYDYKSVKKAGFNKALIENGFLKSVLPLTGSLETPDTPRAAYVHKEPDLIKLLMIINSFMPNSVPLVNSGQELMETQPMNLGLDNDENGRFVLAKSDPQYGKLAFFDMYCLNWQNESEALCNVLCDTLDIRNKYQSIVTDKRNFVLQPEMAHNQKLTTLCYYDKASGDGLLIAANRSDNSRALLNLKKHLPVKLLKTSHLTVIYDKNGKCEEQVTTEKGIYLKPFEVVILHFNNRLGGQ